MRVSKLEENWSDRCQLDRHFSLIISFSAFGATQFFIWHRRTRDASTRQIVAFEKNYSYFHAGSVDSMQGPCGMRTIRTRSRTYTLQRLRCALHWLCHFILFMSWKILLWHWVVNCYFYMHISFECVYCAVCTRLGSTRLGRCCHAQFQYSLL